MKNTKRLNLWTAAIALIILLAPISCKKDGNDALPIVKDPYYAEGTLANVADFPVGTAYEAFFNTSDPLYAAIVDSHFNSITAENSMKLYSIWKQGPGTEMNFRGADALVDWALTHRKRVHGHALLWFFNEESVPWVTNYTGTPEEFEAIYKNYVQTVVGRYKGKVASWDVINEAVTDFPVVPRDDMYRRILGDNYIYKLFRWAEEADPDALLFYNDYSTETSVQKLDKVLELCDDARRQGAKIDGIGFQTHVYFPKLMTYQQYYDVFKKVADKGYLIHISELDIPINNYPIGQFSAPPLALFNQQYHHYKMVARAYRDAVPKDLQFGITVWGATDKYNWLSQPDFYLNNQLDWPCLYDAALQQKPAFQGFLDGLR
jgi:endo-1,4-beta-xylanase